MKIRIAYRIQNYQRNLMDWQKHDSPLDILVVDYMSRLDTHIETRYTNAQIEELNNYFLELGKKYGRKRTS